MASAKTISYLAWNDPILVHAVQLKPTIKVQITGRMASIGISDVVTVSVYSEKIRMKKLMMMMMMIKMIIGERAKRARHSQVCSIENRGYIIYIYIYIVRANFVLITRKEGGA